MGTDPLGRDDFSDRPDTPEFWKLSEIILQMDWRMEEGDGDIGRLVEEVIDPEVLMYFAMHRMGTVLQRGGYRKDPELFVLLVGTWIDAFVAGAKFGAK